MKVNLIIKLVLVVVLVGVINACEMELEPYDSKSEQTVLSNLNDLQTATYGTYAGLVSELYTRNGHFLGEYGSDDVALCKTSGDDLYNVYTYTHYPAQQNTTNFWSQAYHVIFSANQIIARVEDGESSELDQLKGENLYLRAMMHFELSKYFGRPYSHGAGQNLGVPIIDEPEGDELPFRNTVSEIYDFVIADLKKAADLMTVNKPASFASKEVAYALLSRIYLYKGENEKAIEYANLVINSNRYQLLQSNDFINYFRKNPDSNNETIFAIRHMVSDNREKNSIGSMYYTDGASGWGQMYASLSYMELLNEFPNDLRKNFIELQRDINGDTIKRGGVAKLYILKYSYQDDIVNLSSPVYLRLAEMYLNRAEANAKLGNNQLAIDDVNLIRQRAGLSGNALWTLEDLNDQRNILDVVLDERRLELAFESHRTHDLFRNNRTLVRAYPGYHSPDLYNLTIPSSDDRVIFFIPEREIIVNPNLEQNP